MINKHPIRSDLVRTPPKQFSWLDHRLVSERRIEHLSHEAATLYLFLVTVADSQGLSYYADSSVCQRLAMTEAVLSEARDCLQKNGLVAYKAPLYQVLAIQKSAPENPVKRAAADSRDSSLMSLRTILKQLSEGVQ